MPVYPSNKVCSELGCKAQRSTLNSFCIDHGGKEYIANRDNSIYQTAAWRSIRGRQLSIQPLCQACLSRGRVEQAIHVDHLFPWKHIGRHAFDHNVFQSLCQADHSHKTQLEKKGIYVHYTAAGEKQYTKDDYAYIVQGHANVVA